jgi:hypothetical protein
LAMDSTALPNQKPDISSPQRKMLTPSEIEYLQKDKKIAFNKIHKIMNAPKVFISHASEDKERFVTEFATKLRTKGVEAWVDDWEILRGDNLVDKIFEKGLKEADTVIIILSNNSVNKPWVREELSVSVVKRIINNTKIIPIVLDDCNIPTSLTATAWVKIDNLSSYQDSFDNILSSLFGMNNKPALGTLPSYVSSPYNEIGGLTKIENFVLKKVCDYIVQQNWFLTTDFKKVFGNNFEFSDSQIEDSIKILKDCGFFDIFYTTDDCHITVTKSGFENYAQAYIDNYKDIKEKTISAIVNENIEGVKDIASKIKEPVIIIYHIFKIFKTEGYIELIEYSDMDIWVESINPSLRRMLL